MPDEAYSYSLTNAEKTFCPNCSKEAYLLSTINFDPYKPAFYICFDCKFIGQVGIGPVKNKCKNEG